MKEIIMEPFNVHPLVKLKLLGIDLSISNQVIMLWIVVIVIFTIFFIISRRAKIIPTRLQSLIEMVLDYFKKEAEDVMGDEGSKWFPFISTLFLFILLANLIGLVPGAATATANLSVTAAMALFVFITYHYAGIKKFGLLKYLKTSFFPPGLPKFIIYSPLMPILVLIEIISHLVRPFSLSVRLAANMTAGHLVILAFLGLIIYFKSYIIAIGPLALVIFMYILEIIFCIIQAYVFSLLTAMYIGGAVQEHI